MKPTIALIFTGGTLSMKMDTAKGGAVPALSGEEILAQAPGIGDLAELRVENYSLLPGPHVTPQGMLALAKYVDTLLHDPSVVGVVITHGTDTLEETAFLHDLVVRDRKPVVFVGAMRNSSELSWDGPANLVAAVRVAVAPVAANLGVVVVMNDLILAASDVTKTHTESVDTFQSRDSGPLGHVDKEAVLVTRQSIAHPPIEVETLEEKVELIMVASGSKGTLIDHAIADGVRGLVLVGMGRGNVPPTAVPALRRAIERGVVVVLTSRCPKGRLRDSYAYEGGGKQLTDLGVILGGNLPGHQARLLLMALLGSKADAREVRRVFGLF